VVLTVVRGFAPAAAAHTTAGSSGLQSCRHAPLITGVSDTILPMTTQPLEEHVRKQLTGKTHGFDNNLTVKPVLLFQA